MVEPVAHKRVDYPEQPNRCQAIAGSNQCQYVQVEGSQYCHIHGGNVAVQEAQKQARRMYLSAQWQAKIGQFADHPQIKSLREEIGILRMLMAEKLEQCKSVNDLLLRSSSISELVVKIQKLVESCDRIDKSVGQLLDREQVAELGNEIIQIVARYLTDPDILQKFAVELVDTIARNSDPLTRRNQQQVKS